MRDEMTADIITKQKMDTFRSGMETKSTPPPRLLIAAYNSSNISVAL